MMRQKDASTSSLCLSPLSFPEIPSRSWNVLEVKAPSLKNASKEETYVLVGKSQSSTQWHRMPYIGVPYSKIATLFREKGCSPFRDSILQVKIVGWSHHFSCVTIEVLWSRPRALHYFTTRHSLSGITHVRCFPSIPVELSVNSMRQAWALHHSIEALQERQRAWRRGRAAREVLFYDENVRSKGLSKPWTELTMSKEPQLSLEELPCAPSISDNSMFWDAVEAHASAIEATFRALRKQEFLDAERHYRDIFFGKAKYPTQTS